MFMDISLWALMYLRTLSIMIIYFVVEQSKFLYSAFTNCKMRAPFVQVWCSNVYHLKRFPTIIVVCVFAAIVLLLNATPRNIWVHPKCKCTKGVQYSDQIYVRNSTCVSSMFRGLHQNVVSYSFYGNTNSTYFKGVPMSAEGIAQFYPGWTMRLYHNIDPSDKQSMVDLCSNVCKYPHLDECYVGDISDQFDNISSSFGMLWRFTVLGDPTVDTFMVRDLDSRIIQREVDAVNYWLASNKTFHIMRDHSQHGTSILGGMWGARNTPKHIFNHQIHSRRFFDAKYGGHHGKGFDQSLLTEIVWPIAKNDMLAHDSYLCHLYPETTPWPSARVNGSFVGNRNGEILSNECPIQCRPNDHKDWMYC